MKQQVMIIGLVAATGAWPASAITVVSETGLP